MLLEYLFPGASILPEKLAVFLLLRATIAFCTGLAEIFWLYALSKKLSRTVVAWTAFLLLTCAGMNHSAAAFLPSATWNMVSLIAFGLFLLEKDVLFVILAVTATLTTGWPFGAVMLVPCGLRILYRSYQFDGALPLLYIFIVGVTSSVQVAVMMVDHEFYGNWTSTTMNIIRYNALGGGDELYGVEPLSFYIKNLLLNCNLAAVLGSGAIIVSYFTQRRDWDVWFVLLSMWMWIAITFPRKHKEERFIIPMYPLLCLGATLTIDAGCNAVGRLIGAFSRHKELRESTRMFYHAVLWVPAAILSLCRTAALARYYTAPLYIYAALARHEGSGSSSDGPSRVCTCGEWYRFPSSFFLPPTVDLGFLPSSFKGQLPQPFSKYGSLPESRDAVQPFNDRNLEEASRYVNTDECDWIIDLQGAECLPEDADIVARHPFLDAHHTSTLHRVLYIPFLHEGKYLDYVLAKTNGQMIG